ncbi:MAG: tail fiber domain-containing protein [Saprospiraceae bacterium]|nr:tail fiber domain-containing protein [Saprospiraceae bacterium]
MRGVSTNSNGVYGFSGPSIGVRGVSTSSYGVYGTSDNDVGILGTSTNGAGLQAYSQNSTGTASRGGTFDFDAIGPGMDYGATSSRRWKRNIQNIPDPLLKISLLRGVYFDWDEAHGGHHDVGFIAEEIGEVLPEIVGYEKNGIDATAMDYSKMTPLLLEAMNAMRHEYQQKIDSQQVQINDLSELLAQVQKNVSEVVSMMKP